ncbi:MAG: hypothetical protein ABSC20_06130 [Candidatus Bathyarchaeia archaeon]|jgi:hypothetical protein
MDKIKKIQIGLLVLGMVIFGIGTYVIYTFRTLGLEGGLLVTTGLAVALSGFRHQKQREKTIQRPKEMTLGRFVTLIGLIIFFPSLGVALVGAALNIKSSWFLIPFVLVFLVGIPLTLLGGQLMKSEKKSDTSKPL